MVPCNGQSTKKKDNNNNIIIILSKFLQYQKQNQQLWSLSVRQSFIISYWLLVPSLSFIFMYRVTVNSENETTYTNFIFIILGTLNQTKKKNLVKYTSPVDYLRVQCFFDADPSLNPGFTSFNLSHDLFNILQLIAALPKHSYKHSSQLISTKPRCKWQVPVKCEEDKGYSTRILHDFFGCFAFHFTGDVLNIIPSPFLVRLNELVEISLVPHGKALLNDKRYN